jgi:hypothetical protein
MKPLSKWDEADARQLLTDSPWVKSVEARPVQDLSPFARRDGGNINAGVGKGVGLAGPGMFGARREAEAIERAHTKPPGPMVVIRWESALPVRVAEQKAGETGAPELEGDDYAIVICGIPTPDRWNLANELKGVAFLRRDYKKDLKPSHVRILRHDDGTADLVYLFPRSVEIAKKEGRIEFAAQIDRLFVSQDFFTQDMQLQGELQLLMPSEGPSPKR